VGLTEPSHHNRDIVTKRALGSLEDECASVRREEAVAKRLLSSKKYHND